MISIVKGIEKEKSLLLKIRNDNDVELREIIYSNYFFIDANDIDFVNETERLDNYFTSYKLVNAINGKFYKAFLKKNYHRKYARKALEDEGIITYEADVNTFKRYLIDKQDAKLNHCNLKKIWLDIETVDVNPLKKDLFGKVEAVSPIMSCAVKDDETKEVKFFVNKALTLMDKEKLKELKETYLDKDKKIPRENYGQFVELMFKCEKELLKEIFIYMQQKDMYLAWNGHNFDFAYLKQRMKIHDMYYNKIFGNDMDYLQIYKINSKYSKVNVDNYKLETVSYEELKVELEKEGSEFKNIQEIKKLDWKTITKAQRYIDLYLFYPKVLKEYNIQDVHLMDLIEQKLHLLDLNAEQSKISGCPIAGTVFDSYNSDYLLLNGYKTEKYVCPSKPTEEVVAQRSHPLTGSFPPGGYTYAKEKGLHMNLHCFDYKSQYPTTMITFNISPETYLSEKNPLQLPEIHEVFTKEEYDYILFVLAESKKHLDANGKLKTSYDNAIDNDKMIELMWKFTKNYQMKEISSLAKKNNFVFTPADLNRDTRGWMLHPHYCFTREKEGVASKIQRVLITERDKVKYELKNITDEYEKRSKDNYQKGLKVSSVSLYGAFGFRSFRFFKYELPTAITTAARYLTKKSILFAEGLGFKTSHGDTDSAFIKEDTNTITIDELEDKFFEYYNDYIKPFNTICEIELYNKKTNKKEKCRHFLVFEKEKFYESCIVSAKKRYYYKEVDGDKITYGTQGGAFKRKGILQMAKDYQKELVKDVLDKNFNTELWKDKILALRTKVFTFGLSDEEVVRDATLSRSVENFGKPVIDGSTGLQKLRKSDGEPMFAPIPAHIKVAKRLLAAGEILEIDDKIKYVVINSPPIEAITLEEYKVSKKYDAEYYWKGIESVLKEIIELVDYKACYTTFRDCWSLSDKQIARNKRK